MDLAQVLQERLDHLAFGTGADAVNDLDQEIDQAVDDLLAPLPAKRRDQGVAHRLRDAVAVRCGVPRRRG